MNAITRQEHKRIFAIQARGDWNEAAQEWLNLGDQTRAEMARFIAVTTSSREISCPSR